MAVILQIDLLQFFLALVAAILGFLAASLAPFIKDWDDRRRLRRALYSEIIMMYDALSYISESSKRGNNLSRDNLDDEAWKEGYVVVRRSYGYLKNALRGDTYSYAKALPALYYGIKDIKGIESVYIVLNRFFTIECEVLGLEMTHPRANPWNQMEALEFICTRTVNALDRLFKKGMLDKKLLFKESDPASDSREYWKKIA
ncbi:MAG: hypothetical protein WBZ42_02095 [Halobacteriota archaeon]